MKHTPPSSPPVVRPESTLDEMTTDNDLRWWVSAWNRFFFAKADPATLGLIRVCAGLAALYVHLCYLPGLMQYIGPQAWIDTTAGTYITKEMKFYQVTSSFREGPWEPLKGDGQFVWSVYYHLRDAPSIYLVHAAVLVVFALFTAGLWTRVTSVLAWAAAMQYVNRVPTMLFGMDTMMIILLFYLMIGNSGGAFSVDRWWAKRRARAAGLPEPPAESVSANLAIRLLQIHFCFIYAGSGLSKLLGGTWWSGRAIWLTVANGEFAPVFVPGYVPMLEWLCANRWAFEMAMTAGTWGTLLVEIGVPFLIWNRRLRWVCICSSIGLHVGIGLMMGLTTFSLMMITMVLSFVPPTAVRHLVGSLSDGARRMVTPGGAARAAAEKKLVAAR